LAPCADEARGAGRLYHIGFKFTDTIKGGYMDKVQEQVARRAYELFQARGGEHGYHIADWLQAEKEIMSKQPKASAPVKPAAPVNKPAAPVKPAEVVKPSKPAEAPKVTKPAEKAKTVSANPAPASAVRKKVNGKK